MRFGMLADFRERSLDKWMLRLAVEAAWRHHPQRLWTTTTSIDDPRVLLDCQWAGFGVFDTRRETVSDPRSGA